MKESLSIQQARKLALLSQQLPPREQAGSATAATLSAIEHLGYAQIDTISVVERAHHHTLWNRNPRYEASQLDQLVSEKRVFEYWSHAAAYLPSRDFRFTLPRKRAFLNGDLTHWYERDEMMIKFVLERITAEGPLMAKDFAGGVAKKGEWQAKPAKRALEYLFMQGDLMVSSRVNFHKVYDLTERVLPKEIDTTVPEPEEYARFLITQFLRAHGLGKTSEISYLRTGLKPLISDTLKEMVSSGELLDVKVENEFYFAMPGSLELFNHSLPRRKLVILSPFDNFIIQRQRVKELFDFDYLIECYLPEKKRKYGYFSLPILWDGKLVARMDCKALRAKSLLSIQHLAVESGFTRIDQLCSALAEELKSFLRFCGCRRVQLLRTSPAKAKSVFEKALGDLIA